MIIGLTGSIGAGKSTVAKRLVALGAHVLDADAFARLAVLPGSEGLKKLTEAFGEDLLDESGALKRKALAARVFDDEKKLHALNALLHPVILSSMRESAHRLLRESPNAVVVYDMPLLIEAGEHERVDSVWVVTANEETRVKRVMERDACTREEALSRMAAQMSEEKKRAYADIVLDNSNGLDALFFEVDAQYARLKGTHGKT